MMMFLPPDGERLESLRRSLRDPEPRVWQAASVELAGLAETCYAADEEIRRLLQCPYEELRLRGLAALTERAGQRPDEARDFILDALRGAEIETDPVLADALFGLLPHLPLETACRLLEQAVEDPRETVRAAAAASLGAWRGWRGALLLPLAYDPSPRVRMSVALALSTLRDLREAGEALEAVASSPEEFVRSYLAEIMDTTPRRREPPRGVASKVKGFDTARLGRLLDEPDCRVRLVVSVEELFCTHPENIFEIVSSLLERPGMPSLLDQVAWLARDAGVATLCRALHGFLCPNLERGEVLLAALDTALASQRGRQAQIFRAAVRECTEAAAARTTSELGRWARRVDGARYAPLIEVVSALEEIDGMTGLQDLLGQFDGVYARIEAEIPMPQRRLQMTVARCWYDLLDEELQEQVCGVNS